VLAAATLTTGLVAGVFGLYAHTIMPGLRHADNKTFVGAFQSIDKAIINPWFMAAFFGALVLTGLAAAFHITRDNRGVVPWIGAAFILYLIAVVITLAVQVPLKDAIKAEATRPASATSPRSAGTSARPDGPRGTSPAP